MIKKILAIVLVIIVLGGGFWLAKKSDFTANPKTETETPIEKVNINPVLTGQTLPLSNDPKDAAWALFQKYLGYNKNKDVVGIESVVYKIAPVCEDPKTRIDCEARMGAAYSYGSQLKKEDFTNVWQDDKQIILSSDFKVSEDKDSLSRTRAIIYFVNTGDGFKLLSFSPFKGVVVGQSAASHEELLQRLITYTEDKDQDGIADYEEECLNVTDKSTCTPTNPKLRDTDGNGFWDGIQSLMK